MSNVIQKLIKQDLAALEARYGRDTVLQCIMEIYSLKDAIAATAATTECKRLSAELENLWTRIKAYVPYGLPEVYTAEPVEEKNTEDSKK